MERMIIPYSQFIVIPYSIFVLLMEGAENSADAFAVYYRLLMQVQMQWTNITDSTDLFMQKAMNMSNGRYVKAKSLLSKKGLIKPHPVKDDKWRIVAHLLEVFTVVEWEYIKPSIERITLAKKKSKEEVSQTSAQQSHPVHNIENPGDGESTTKNNTSISTINNNTINKDNIDNSNTNINNIIITSIYSKLKEEGLAYSSTPEDLKFAFILSKDKVFLQACSQVGWAETLVKTIMNFAFIDEFWRGKIISIWTFYKHWYWRYSNLKLNNKFKPVLSKEQSEELTELFASL